MSVEVLRDVIRLTNIKEHTPIQAFFEEDILVPDIKPDVGRVGGCSLNPRLTEKENYAGVLKLGGDMYLEVMYTPAVPGGAPVEVACARIPFRHEVQTGEITGELEVVPNVEHLEVSVINERKLRIKTVIGFSVKEYQDIEKQVFRGFRNDVVEMLDKKTEFADVLEHIKDQIEVKDEIRIKEGMQEIDRILKSDFRVAETYRKITQEKAIISGILYYDIMYLGEGSEPEPETMSGTIEFTHFIKPEKGDEITGSDLLMKVDDIRAVPKRDDEDNMTMIDIIAGLSLRLDTYTNRSMDIVEDAYHSRAVLDIEKDEIEIMTNCGSGRAELSVREKLEIKSHDNIEKVIMSVGEALPAGGEIGKGVFTVEGVLLAEILYISDEANGLRSFTAEIPFKGAAEMPGAEPGMDVNAEFTVKRVSAEKVSDRQIEVFAEIIVSVKGNKKEQKEYIKNAGVYEELYDREDNRARLVLYMTKKNDRLWDVGKKYRIPLTELKEINGLDEGLPPEFAINGGEKLLIWS